MDGPIAFFRAYLDTILKALVQYRQEHFDER